MLAINRLLPQTFFIRWLAASTLTALLTESWSRDADGERLTPEQAGHRWAVSRASGGDQQEPRSQARRPS